SNYDYEASFYIKRVVAADKDKVRYHKLTGKLYVNDLYVEDITYEEYLNITNSIDYDYGPGIFYEFIVPDNQLLVFGDNRTVSRDSRLIGLIDKGDVLGKAFFRIFPFDDFGVVR
ncbi:MAG: signal peptidase I, partial [Acholeplasmatales bacterium]|nr:signal peptidase I [Acholeplasmatales bacterium]